MYEKIINILGKGPRSIDSMAILIMQDEQRTDLFDLMLTEVPNAIRELQKEGLVGVSHTVPYFAGKGNGLAVKTFYKLS